MTPNNIPEFEPNIPAHLLDGLPPKDRYLHEQLSITGQLVRHVASVQAASAAERRELVQGIRDLGETVRHNHAAFVAHTEADAKVFREQAAWQNKHDDEVRSNFAALKWLRFDTYLNARVLTRVVIAVVTALLTGAAIRQLIH